jgi:hypothetical protein
MHIALRSLFAVLLVSLALTFVQCKGGKSGKVNMTKPEDVSLAFLRYFSQLDIAKAKELCTPEGQEMMGMLEGMMGMMGEEEKKQVLAESEAAVKALKKSTCKIDGDVAKCIVCCSPSGESSEEPVELRKIDGKWYVHLDKEGMGD